MWTPAHPESREVFGDLLLAAEDLPVGRERRLVLPSCFPEVGHLATRLTS